MKLNIGNPDSFWSYIVVVSAMVIHFTIFGTALSFSIFLKVIMNEFHSSRSTTAWFNSIQSGIFYFSGPVVSLLLKRYNWRILIILGAILNGFGLSISFFAQSVYFLYGSIGIFVGIGYGLIHISTVVAVGAYFNKMNERSFAQACSLTGGTIGTLIMPLVTYKLIDIYGFRGAFLMLGAFMFQITLFGCLIPPLNPIAEDRPMRRAKIAYSLPAITLPMANIKTNKVYEQKQKLLNDTMDPTPIDESPENGVDNETPLYYGRLLSLTNNSGRRYTFAAPMTYEVALENSSHTLEAVRNDKLKHSDLFRNPKCLVFVLMSAAWNSSVVIIMHLLFDFLLVDRALKPAINAAWITCIIMISAMIGNFLASLLGIFSSAEIPSNDTDAYNKLSCGQKMLGSKYLKSWIFNITTVIHGLVATPLFLVSKRFEVLCMVAALFGCPLGIKMALGPTICVDLFGVQNLPFIYGYTMMASGAGILISPPLGGYLADITKNYNITFCLSAVLSAISFVMFSIQLIMEQRKERKEINQRKI